MSLLLATSHPASSAPLPVPERGFVSSQPARIWEEGLICGNGTIGANALSQPTNERIIFTHERLFMPMNTPVMPPDQSARLFDWHNNQRGFMSFGQSPNGLAGTPR